METESPPTAAATLPTELLEALARRIEDGKIEFPSMPDVASQVVSATFDEDCDLARVERIVQRDPHLTAQLLKTVNSALYAPAKPVTALRQALATVGLTRVRDIALLVSCESRVFQIEGFEEQLNELLEHAKMSAVYAREVAKAARKDQDEAFCAGLLHDVGRAILIQSIVDLRVILGVKLRRKIVLDPQAVVDASATRHGEVGAGLLAAWALPERLVEAVRGHHAPEQVEDPECRALATVLRVADDLAHATADERTVAAAAEIGLDDVRVSALAGRRAELEALVREL